MQIIRNWNDLEKFGIVPLTGEACALSLRILCDLTARGQRLIQSLFSLSDLKVTLELRPAWNGSIIRLNGEGTEEKATTSIMLPHDILPTLAVYCLLDAGCEEVYMAVGKPVSGMKAEDFEELKATYPSDPEHAAAVFQSNLRYMYGTTEYEGQQLNCWRTIRLHGTAGSRRLDPAFEGTTMRKPATLEERTRNQHQMSGRTV
jgi:hypothetical protein